MVSSTSVHVLSTAMHRRTEHIEAALLICQSPASNSNYIFSAVFTYFWGVFYAKSVGFWGGAPDPGGGAYSAPPHPLAGREGCPSPAPSLGRPRLLLRPTPRHTLAGAPPPSQFLDPPLTCVRKRTVRCFDVTVLETTSIQTCTHVVHV